MNILLQRCRTLIFQLRKNYQIKDAKDLLNEIVLFLNSSIQNQTDGLHVLSIICHDLAGLYNLPVFNNSEIMNHQFFIIVSNTFMMLLTKLTFIHLTKQDIQCFDDISLLISNLCLNRNKISTNFYIDNNEKLNPNNKEKFNVISYEKIFFTESFVEKFVRIIDNDIAINYYEPYHIKYRIIDRLLRLCIKLKDIDHKLILDAVMKCLESKIYKKLYTTINLRQPILTPQQSFFMYQCPKFIRLCSDKRQNVISQKLSEPLINLSSDIFANQLPVIYKEHARIQAIAWYIELLNHFALTPSTRVQFIMRIDFDKTIVDQMIEILQTESLIKSVRENAESFHTDVALMSYAITLLYNLTFEKKIFWDLKTKNVIATCKKLFNAKDKTIQFASRTLDAILNQKEINEIDSPSVVARSYLYFIENTIDDITLTYHGIKLDGILTNLETIVHNDDIKEEITNDGEGIPLIARCAYESNFDIETIQRPALEIISAISFANDSAIEQIKENDILMDHIKKLSDRNDKDQEITVNRILWKVEQETEFILNQKVEKKRRQTIIKKKFKEGEAIYQYVRGDYHIEINDGYLPGKFDVMLSYCHCDKEICSKIYTHLNAEDFGQVLFHEKDIDSIHPRHMAKAIECSSIVIICFSNKYEQSYACRLEAEYAKKRQRTIIAVKLEPGYDAKGWLEDIIDTKYIDFTKSEITSACTQLIKKIYETNEENNNI